MPTLTARAIVLRMFVRMNPDEVHALRGRKAAEGLPRARPGVHQKYRNQRVTDEDGLKFDSKAEHRHWLFLKARESAGEITALRRQVVFELAPPVEIQGRIKRALRYIADFVYTDPATGHEVVEDVKGAVTQAWEIKRHLMASVHGIEVREIRA